MLWYPNSVEKFTKRKDYYKWQIYYDELDKYLKSLVDTHKIPAWRAYMVKGVAAIMQTNAVLNAPYYKEELPDISLDSFDGDVQE